MSKERKDGSILRIKLVNFMTFGFCEFVPGPALNIILGPNGSGKSSRKYFVWKENIFLTFTFQIVVCAICLGLGGKPSLLGRAESISGFIKKGQSTASVEIELYQKDKPSLIIVRKFSSENATVWQLNGTVCTAQEVLRKLKELKIQVDNLCQFLPQDKVTEFSKFNDKELLHETVRTILGESHIQKQKWLSNCTHAF